MKYDFRKVSVLPNLTKDKGLQHTKKLISYLAKEHKVLVQESFSELADGKAIFAVDDGKLFSDSELVIVLGGDGSILRAAGKASRLEKPLIGINLGHLGYIAELETSDIPHINEILSGELEADERTMLEAEVIRNGSTVISDVLALNDAAIVRASGLGVIRTELLCNGVPVYNYRGDGLIVATATGSSAYSMSAGGPVMDTGLDCMSVTPICAHSLRCRPIVFSGSCVFEVKNYATPDQARLSLDGAEVCALEDDDIVRIKKSSYTTKLLRASGRSFCSILYRKMSDI